MNALKKLRLRSGLTQQELAEKLCITQGAISQWELGNASPSAQKLPEIARIFGCTVDALFQDADA
mgnify:CR=1 FL=1